ncbi:hypothetical protein EVAR_40609_1 [Eumeta japonica]|uniref:Uncharacterized protein n=1 Tax=Eumeta variegata TaxID=151549 RepID=A0A4C1XFG4_EUMVA|nr:hypothetical protein EVAR_40609_1 [Eumeta japonica]
MGSDKECVAFDIESCFRQFSVAPVEGSRFRNLFQIESIRSDLKQDWGLLRTVAAMALSPSATNGLTTFLNTGTIGVKVLLKSLSARAPSVPIRAYPWDKRTARREPAAATFDPRRLPNDPRWRRAQRPRPASHWPAPATPHTTGGFGACALGNRWGNARNASHS